MQGKDSAPISERVFKKMRTPIRAFGMAAVLGLTAGLVSLSAPAVAQDTILGNFKDWTAHSYQEPDSLVCNMWSRPIDSKPANVRRGEIYAFVTHRPGVNSRSAVSFQMGYPLRPGQPVTVQIGNQRFNLAIEGEAAFAETRDEAKLVAAMRRGNRMIVRGTSTRGTKTTDTYSLSGVTAAAKAIDQGCPS